MLLGSGSQKTTLGLSLCEDVVDLHRHKTQGERMKQAVQASHSTRAAVSRSRGTTEGSRIIRQFIFALMLLAGVFLIGTAGYMIIGAGRWSLIDCAYMTAISLTTVGYGDVLGIDNHLGAKVFTMGLLVAGMGVTLYSVSSLTALVVESQLYHLFELRKMKKELALIQDHFIVCGGGSTGSHIVQEFIDTHQPFVLIEQNEEVLEQLRVRFPGILYVKGNAMEEMVLHEAGIDRAKGLVAALHLDSENMFLTVSSHFFNPTMKIAVKCVEHHNTELFRRAGASYVVSPHFIGGMRLASELLRPHVVSFLDKMLRSKQGGESVRVSDVTVTQHSPHLNKTLEATDIYGHCGLQVVAIGHIDDDDFTYNPPPSSLLREGSVLVVIGTSVQITSLERFIRG